MNRKGRRDFSKFLSNKKGIFNPFDNSAFPISNSAFKKPYAFSILTLAPSATFLKTLASPVIFPITFTALAGRTSFPRLTGVGPKKMQKALPLGQ
jgi:hypothetical protein